jgi:hypothetical protein
MDQSWSNLWICAWIRVVGVAGNLRKVCCVHAESRVGFPPNTSQRRYLVQLSKRNSARTAASSSLMKHGLADGLKFVETWLLLFGLIRIKYLVELVGVAGPFPFCERLALIGWRPDWRQFKAGSSRCVTSGDRAGGRWEASVWSRTARCDVRLTEAASFESQPGHQPILTEVFCCSGRPSRHMSGRYVMSGHGCFIPYHF